MKAIRYVLLVLFFASASTMMAVDYKLHQTSSAKVKSTATLEYYGVSGNTAIFHLAHSASFKEISSAPKMCFQSTSTMSRVGSSLPQAAETGVTTTTDHLTLRGPARIGGGNSGGGSGPSDKTDPWKTPIGDVPWVMLLIAVVAYSIALTRKQRTSVMTVLLLLCLVLPQRALAGDILFSVSPTQRVAFSPGNLQYRPAYFQWRFAENQWDYVGEANSNIADGYDGWIDLFGWGTGDCPTKTTEDDYEYQTFVDWGSNWIGNDAPGTWRTLTSDEWTYIFRYRPNAQHLFARGNINGTNGLIILPDQWTCPDGVTFVASTTNGLDWDEELGTYSNMTGTNDEDNTYTLEQWAKMEQAGAIFLPASGFRIGTTDVYNLNFNCDLWSCTESGENRANYLSSLSNFLQTNSSGSRNTGRAVRLVKTVSIPTGVFSVAADRQITFAPGNLQYTQSTDTWSFASAQWEILGSGNVIGNSSSYSDCCGSGAHGTTLADKIDLFGWGTGDCPTKISTDRTDYSTFVDWGMNPIDVYTPNTWRTLNHDEWDYILNQRPNATSLHGVAQVNGVNGFILLPDDWTCPEGVTFKSGFHNNWSMDGYADYQTFDLEQWSTLETTGAIFLPAAGYRIGKDVLRQDHLGYQWTATQYNSNYAWNVAYRPDYKNQTAITPYAGYSVRLAKDVGEVPEEPFVPTGVFSVDADKQITFSPGVLQYTQSTNTWDFARTQWEILGTDNVIGGDVTFDDFDGYSKYGTALADKIDLFGWSTSATNFGVSTSTNNSDYSGSFVDWGSNPIGADAPGTWHTLTEDEWNYLVSTRPNAASLWGIAQVNGVNGLILLPDDWTCPEGLTFHSGENIDGYADHQTFNAEQWAKMEQAGAIFLPATGCRDGMSVNYVHTEGYSWSSTNAAFFHFKTDEWNMFAFSRFFGHSVRLVKIAETPEVPEEPETPEPPFVPTGLFTIALDRQVTFSPGNLQYTQSTDTWSFASAQWEMLGIDNVIGGSMSSSYYGDDRSGTALADKIDLFGWSTDATYFGVSTSTNNSDYSGSFVDWGNNQIGADAPNTWRTLSHYEWYYLLNYRPNAASLCGIAQVNGVNGIILLPDDWICPEGITFKPGVHNDLGTVHYAVYQTFDLEQWTMLEAAGAIFLPAAGFRSGRSIYYTQYYNNQWTSTRLHDNYAWVFHFNSNEKSLNNSYPYAGNSVRLVKDVGEVPEEPEVPEVPLVPTGVFSISADRHVNFSPGNLQYTQSTDTWSFARTQHEILGIDNLIGGYNYSDSYGNHTANATALADKIDLFGWGTGDCPTKISTGRKDYPTFVDWGSNSIGTDAPGTWRTLSHDEWDYLINIRPNAASLMGVAMVNGVNGVILLPDDWTCPANVTFRAGYPDEWSSSLADYARHQSFSLDLWSLLEAAGAIFLPAGGIRYKGYSAMEINNVLISGNYWSSTKFADADAFCTWIDADSVHMSGTQRYYGYSVRLVKDIEAPQEPETPETPEVLYMPDGVFTVAFDKQITFSPGNLQYTQSTDTWSFARTQYEMIGTDNIIGGSVGADMYGDYRHGYGWADKIDLFAGSSEANYFGVTSSEDYEDYSGSFVDWGSNPIGTEAPNTWHTLTGAEWYYLRYTRTNADSLCGIAQVNGVNGAIFLPDNWTCPEGITFKSGFQSDWDADYASYQTFTVEQWTKMEQAGAIFLPAAGSRSRYSVQQVQRSGDYHSSYGNSLSIQCSGIYASNSDYSSSHYRGTGYSVRLVKDLPIQVDPTTAKVTSTSNQTVCKAVRLMISNEVVGKTDITVTSDNPAFTVMPLTNVGAGEHELIVYYTPTATTDGIETASITLTSPAVDKPYTFQMTGRHLPENFVIAVRNNNGWVALTADISGNGFQKAVPIVVDDEYAPTIATFAPDSCRYQLLGLTGDRFTANGSAVHLYSTITQKVLGGAIEDTTETHLSADLTHNEAQNSANALYYEWILHTEDLECYRIVNSTDMDVEYYSHSIGYCLEYAMWGKFYADGSWDPESENWVWFSKVIYLLPIASELVEKDMEVMEWGTNSMVLRLPDADSDHINITLAGATTSYPLTPINGSDLYQVNDIDLTSHRCETMIIADDSNNGAFLTTPILVTDEAYTYSYWGCDNCDIVVLNGAKLTAASYYDYGFANIYVYPGGKLLLEEESMLSVKEQVYLRGGYSWLHPTTYALPEVYIHSVTNFRGSDNIIYDYYIQNYKYYQFALPYSVPLANVTDEAGYDDFPVWVKHYNGALRAADASATSWEWYDGDNFEAGIGYVIAAQPRQLGNVANRPLSIIRFPLGNAAITQAEADMSVATTAHGIDGYKAGRIAANNVGWNYVGNPFLATWQGDIGQQQLTKYPNEQDWDGSYTWVNNVLRYITVMSPEDGHDYDQYIASDTELRPFFPFFMQETADGGKGTIHFAAANRLMKAPAQMLADAPREQFVQIEIAANGVKDQTGLFVSESYSNDLDLDDYEKLFGSASDKAKLWLMHEGKRMAFEAMTEQRAAAPTALGFRAPQAGRYTLSLNEQVSTMEGVLAVYLTDHELGITDYDLMYAAYEFEAVAAKYNDTRFTIRLVLDDNTGGVATGVDVLDSKAEGIYKFIYQGNLYIYQDGIIYDATGRQVTTISKQ